MYSTWQRVSKAVQPCSSAAASREDMQTQRRAQRLHSLSLSLNRLTKLKHGFSCANSGYSASAGHSKV